MTHPIRTVVIVIVPNALGQMIAGSFTSKPYSVQIIEPIKNSKNVIRDKSFALFLLNILIAWKRFADAMTKPNIPASTCNKLMMLDAR